MKVRIINGTAGIPDKEYPAIIHRIHAGDPPVEVDADTAYYLVRAGAGVIEDEPEEVKKPEAAAEKAEEAPTPKPKKPAAKKTTTKATPKKTTKSKAEEAPEEDPPELKASAVV